MMAVLPFMALSCAPEEVFNPGEPDLDGCYGVYFPTQDATGAHTYDPSQPTEIVFKVARTVSEDEIVVPLKVSASHEGIFKVEELKFEDGQSETEFKVTFPDSQNGINYSLSIEIDDPQYASKYDSKRTFLDFSVLRVEWKYFLNPQTGEPARFTFNQGWWEEVHTGKVKYYEVDGVRTCQTETDPYQYSDGVGYGFWGTANARGEGELSFKWYLNEVDGNGNQVIEHPATFVFNHPNYAADVYMYDWYTYFTIANPQAVLAGVDYLTFVKKYGSSYITSYYDGNGGFYFATAYYHMMNIGGWQIDDYDVTALADGFVRTDYSLKGASDYCVDGVTPVMFEAGIDVAEIKYAILEGEADETTVKKLVNAISADTAENVFVLSADQMQYDEAADKLYGGVNLTCPATGTYTLVAVALDNTGKMQSSTTIVFDYVADDDDTYDVTLGVEVADTPARYEADGFTVYNSFEFTVYGGNQLTDVKIGLYETAIVQQYGMDAVVADLRYEDAQTNSSVPQSVLDKINTTTGYTDLYTKLKDGNSYTLVVWGTNGMQTKVVAAEYQLRENPEVFKSLGLATYTDDIVGTMFSLEPLTYQVPIEESVDNPGKYRLVNAYGKIFPYNVEGDYDPDNDYYLVIDATDPNRVKIPQASLGLDWGYGAMGVYGLSEYFVDSGQATPDQVAAYYGKLEDGVITFPAKSIGLIMGSSLYGSNANGAFKVVLPGYGDEGGAGSEDTPAETTSVDKTSVNAECVALKSIMSKGHIAGVKTDSECRTVAASVSVSSDIEKKSSRRDMAPTHGLVELNF